jgi:hypothetical protein
MGIGSEFCVVRIPLCPIQSELPGPTWFSASECMGNALEDMISGGRLRFAIAISDVMTVVLL